MRPDKLEPQFENFLIAQSFHMVCQACTLQADGVLLRGLVTKQKIVAKSF